MKKVTQRGTHYGRGLQFHRVKKEVGRKSFSYFGSALYNGLPDSLKVGMSYLVFKLKLGSALLLSRINS